MKKITLFVALFAAMTLSAQTPEWVAQIEIEGQQINSLNCQNLHELLNAGKVDKNQEMSVTYDRETSVLRFRNADIKWHDVQNLPFLKVEENLTIVAEGENTVEMQDAKYFIVAKSDVTIQSSSPEGNKLIAYGITWTQVGDKAPYSGIFAYLDGNVNMTISNVISSANYFEHAFVGSTNGAAKLTFNNASVGMIPSAEATMEISEMNFILCAIAKPKDSGFSAELKGIALNGQLVAGEMITIRPVGEGLDQITNDQSSNRKFINDGQLFILRDGKTFNALGVEIK